MADDFSDDGPQRSELAGDIAKARNAAQKEKVDTALSRAPMGSILRYGAVVVLLLISLTMIVQSVGSAGSYDSKSQANLSQIESLRKDLADANSRKDQEVDPDSLRESLDSASSKGKALGSIQRDMGALDFGAKDLDPVLADYHSLTDESKKYFTVGALSGGSFAPQGRWFQPYEPGKNSQGKDAWVQLDKDKWTWEFMPTKTVDDDGNIAGVWTATMVGGDDDGKMLAWVTGSFNPRKAQWFGLTEGITALGKKYAGVSTSTFDFDGDEGTKLDPAPSESDLRDSADKAAEKSDSSSSSSSDSSAAPSSAPASPSKSSSPAPSGAPEKGDR